MIAFLNLRTEPHHSLLKTASSGHSIEILSDFKGSFLQFSFILLLPAPGGSEDPRGVGKELCPLPEKNDGKNSTLKKRDNLPMNPSLPK